MQRYGKGFQITACLRAKTDGKRGGVCTVHQKKGMRTTLENCPSERMVVAIVGRAVVSSRHVRIC